MGRHEPRSALLVIVGLLMTGCSHSAPARTTTTASPPRSTVSRAASTTTKTSTERTAPDRDPITVTAQAVVATVHIYRGASSREPLLTLANPQPHGAPLIFLVKTVKPEWLKVQLPIRPNGSTGWIRAVEVELSQHPYRITIQLAAHRIVVHDGSTVIVDEGVGVGRGETPTPGGSYYTTELLKPPNPNGPFGPYAYGLSGFSDVLRNFNGGEGVIGIHGTNDPASIGKDVSHGCIRVRNETIRMLQPILPLGVPVEIKA